MGCWAAATVFVLPQGQCGGADGVVPAAICWRGVKGLASQKIGGAALGCRDGPL